LSSRTMRFADDKAKPGKPGDATLEGPKERSRAASYRIGKITRLRDARHERVIRMALFRRLALGMTVVSVFAFTMSGGVAKFASQGVGATTARPLGSTWR
jgi:hypothetical protein